METYKYLILCIVLIFWLFEAIPWNTKYSVSYIQKASDSSDQKPQFFWIFHKKLLKKHADIPQLPKYCPALNKIIINTCTFISTLCELFVVKNNRSMQFWRWDFRSFSKKYFWTWKAETATLFASWMYALLQFSIVTKLRADVSLFVPVKSILSRTALLIIIGLRGPAQSIIRP